MMADTAKKVEKTGIIVGVRASGRTETHLAETQRNLRAVPHPLLVTKMLAEEETGGPPADLRPLEVTGTTMEAAASNPHVDLPLRLAMAGAAVAEPKDQGATARHLPKEMINMTLESGSTPTGHNTSDLVALEAGSVRNQSQDGSISSSLVA
jgi:hypothetical protein